MANIPILGKFASATEERILADAEEIAVGNRRLTEALEDKEDAMTVAALWPTGNLFLANGLYSLGTYSSADLTLLFEDGTGAEDMLYISFSLGAGVSLELPGENHIGLEGLPASEGSLLELVGIWNPGLSKWVFVHRSTAL